MSRLESLLTVLLVLGVATLWGKLARDARLGSTPSALSPAALEAIESRGVVLGSIEAPARVVFFSDYQCGACEALELAVWDSLQTLASRGLASVRVIHTPLRAHRRAPRAARLHVCSVDRGAAWLVHRRLFETRSGWAQGPPPDAVFHEVGRAAGLDSATVARCLATESDFVEAPAFLDSVSISGLPTVVVNGRVVRRTAPALLAEIDAAIQRAKGVGRALGGVPGCGSVASLSAELDAGV